MIIDRSHPSVLTPVLWLLLATGFSAASATDSEGRYHLPLLSIGIGSTPSLKAAAEPGRLVTIAVVGGGTAGVEVALCLPSYVRPRLGRGVPVRVTLVTAGPDLWLARPHGSDGGYDSQRRAAGSTC